MNAWGEGEGGHSHVTNHNGQVTFILKLADTARKTKFLLITLAHTAEFVEGFQRQSFCYFQGCVDVIIEVSVTITWRLSCRQLLGISKYK